MRTALILLACAVVLVACEEGAPRPTDPPPTTTGTVSTTAQDLVDLSYSFEPGEVLFYDVELDQRMSVTTEGDSEAADMPAGADLTVRGAGQFSYEVSAGPREGTHRLTITGEFSDLSVEGTLDGEPVDDPAEAGDLGIGQPVAGEIVVDGQGRPVDSEPESELAVAEISADLARFPGPVLPSHPVSIGENWEVSHSETALGSVPVETTVTGTIVGSETVDGAEALVVDTHSATSEGEVDLSAFYRDFLGGVGGEEAPTEALQDIVFRILVDAGAGTTRALLDRGTARVIQATREASNALTMETALPDEATGAPTTFDMRLETEQSIVYRLADATGG
ncbi:MAG TPA: hypothetical protein VHL52_11525 [Acidimicrobiia bacterium]|nr:hypothetical protein [Acidimicrobiia bacterium]